MRTRERILEAAGKVFDRYGFGEATISEIIEVAGVTKGAFYHHFKSDGPVATKVKLAQAILDSTLTGTGVVQDQKCKLQTWVDTGMVLSYRLSREPALRAALHLAMHHTARETYGTPWPAWTQVTSSQLAEAREVGELLPHVDPASVCRVLVGAWAGLAVLTSAIDGDLSAFERESVRLYELFLPALAVPSVIINLDFAADRGARIWAEHLERKG
ncbi:ScbR family autoregulator-binding transcription factor [Streptomyces sp. NPDC059649]|uniref:ScbR family autoregulator-binding transcription factor n=1 Tax=Streptomyces sp. NPDC059649 TaxID=3346895 RepID=UPI0036C22E4F